MATEFFWGAVFQRAMGMLFVEMLEGNDQVTPCRFTRASAKSNSKEVTRFLETHDHIHYFVCS